MTTEHLRFNLLCSFVHPKDFFLLRLNINLEIKRLHCNGVQNRYYSLRDPLLHTDILKLFLFAGWEAILQQHVEIKLSE